MTQEHPLVERYVGRLRDGLSALTPQDRDEIVRDIRSHIAEAAAAGTSLDAVLTALGPADVLARAYAVELLLNPVQGRSSSRSFAPRFFALAGALVVTSIPTIIAVSVLGSVGLSFLFSGVVVFLAGLLDAAGVGFPFVDGTLTQVHPVFAVALGPVMSVVGAAALVALYYYLRWLGRVLTRSLPASARPR